MSPATEIKSPYILGAQLNSRPLTLVDDRTYLSLFIFSGM